jgi:hypothetical protein
MANRWTERLVRASGKLAWSAQSIMAPKPHIELLHRRHIPDERDGDEYVKLCAGSTYIEPAWGYVISSSGYLIDESLLPNFFYHKPPWRIGLASPKAFWEARRGVGKRVEYHPRVISLRHFWEWNYYHFYLDVLGKIQLFDEIGIDPTTPLVLGRYAIELPFVQQIINRGALKERNWIIQDNCYVVADEVYYCRTRQCYKAKMDHLMDLMGIPNHLDNYSNRIFLTRKRNGPRSIANMDQIEPILREYGFRIIDAAELSIAEQIDEFSKTRYLVAIHGAGMTNMSFRRDAPLSVLEIHLATWVNEDFRNMCREWGYEIDRLACQPAGGANPLHAYVYIDPLQLRRKIEQMLVR